MTRSGHVAGILLPLKIIQLFLAFIVLGLASYHLHSMMGAEDKLHLAGPAVLVATAAVSIMSILFFLVATLSDHRWTLFLVLEFFTWLMWTASLAVFVYLLVQLIKIRVDEAFFAVTISSFKRNEGGRNYRALKYTFYVLVGITAVDWLLHCITLLLSAMGLHRYVQEQDKPSSSVDSTPTTGYANSYAPAQPAPAPPQNPTMTHV